MASDIPVPVGQSHHDVKRGQEEHEVEERVAVCDAVLLVVNSAVGMVSLIKILWSGAFLNQSGLVAGQGEFVHLVVVGVSDAGKTRSLITKSGIKWNIVEI